MQLPCQPHEDAGLTTIDAQAIGVTPKGRMFVRASAMMHAPYY